MATAYTVPNFTKDGRTNMSAGQPVVAYKKWTFPSVPVINDTVKLLPIPVGARVLDFIAKADDLDTGGSAAITLSFGDSASATQFLSAATIGQAGTLAQMAIGAAGKLKKYTADDYVSMLVAAGPATGAVGSVEVWLTYCFD